MPRLRKATSRSIQERSQAHVVLIGRCAWRLHQPLLVHDPAAPAQGAGGGARTPALCCLAVRGGSGEGGDLRFLYAGRDRWCPARASGFRCRADPARTRRPRSGLARSPPCAAAGGAPVLRDRGRDRSAVSGWPFLPGEGWRGGPLVCLGGLWVRVEEGPAVLRAARGHLADWRIRSDTDDLRKLVYSTQLQYLCWICRVFGVSLRLCQVWRRGRRALTAPL
jgi:hypothetical protein